MPTFPALRQRAAPWLQRIVPVKPDEIAALLLAFAFFFCLLCAYYLLRPLRDAMGLTGGMDKLPWLFTATFVSMLLAVPLFGFLVARLAPRRFVPACYRFFILNLLGFALALGLGAANVRTGQVFFVWLSVFNLFALSLFWSVMADRFSAEQGQRLFGFVAAGGTAGGLLGPALAATIGGGVGPVALLLIAAALLEVALVCYRALLRHTGSHAQSGARSEDARIGGGVFGGLVLIARSPYLLGIVLYMFLHTSSATLLYFEQARIVAEAFADTAARTRYFALTDLWVSLLTLTLQVFVTARWIRLAGVFGALLSLPVFALLAFGGAALWPVPLALALLQGLRRAFDYAISRPAREILFTVLSREEKYKAKSVIETLVFRGGDVAAGWLYQGLASLGVAFGGVALASLPLFALWGWLCKTLSRRGRAVD
ncbi:hypothetical protein [Niveibacterium sp. SC-1]|uniref:NTP/NDP exchange transporter n=1 Tax=Niveibacterium sp. SC-1 TaxID=3135646 RepID=UPI00311DD964